MRTTLMAAASPRGAIEPHFQHFSEMTQNKSGVIQPAHAGKYNFLDTSF
jgi:hypothetical protein